MIHNEHNRSPRTISREIPPQLSPSSRFGGGQAPAVPRSFLSLSREFRSAVIDDCSSYGGQTRVYIYIYIYVEIGTKCDSPGEQGRGHRGAWGLDILYPSAVFRERISESKVCRQSIRQRGGAASSARTRHDAFERPSLLIRAPLYPNTALRAFMERWNKSGFARDPRMIIGRARSGENSPTGQGSFTAN